MTLHKCNPNTQYCKHNIIEKYAQHRISYKIFLNPFFGGGGILTDEDLLVETVENVI